MGVIKTGWNVQIEEYYPHIKAYRWGRDIDKCGHLPDDTDKDFARSYSSTNTVKWFTWIHICVYVFFNHRISIIMRGSWSDLEDQVHTEDTVTGITRLISQLVSNVIRWNSPTTCVMASVCYVHIFPIPVNNVVCLGKFVTFEFCKRFWLVCFYRNKLYMDVISDIRSTCLYNY